MEYIPNKTNAQRALCDDVSNEIQTFSIINLMYKLMK